MLLNKNKYISRLTLILFWENLKCVTLYLSSFNDRIHSMRLMLSSFSKLNGVSLNSNWDNTEIDIGNILILRGFRETPKQNRECERASPRVYLGCNSNGDC